MNGYIVNDLVGKPYVLGARGPEAYDCWGVVLEVGKRVGLDLPDFHDVIDGSENAHIHLRERGSGRWKTVLRPEPGDVAIVKLPDRLTHAGICLPGNYVIHSIERTGVLVQSIDMFCKAYGRVTWNRYV